MDGERTEMRVNLALCFNTGTFKCLMCSELQKNKEAQHHRVGKGFIIIKNIYLTANELYYLHKRQLII